MTRDQAHAFAEEIYLQMLHAPVWRVMEDVIEGDVVHAKTAYVITTAHVVSVRVLHSAIDDDAYVEICFVHGPSAAFGERKRLQ